MLIDCVHTVHYPLSLGLLTLLCAEKPPAPPKDEGSTPKDEAQAKDVPELPEEDRAKQVDIFAAAQADDGSAIELSLRCAHLIGLT